MRAFTLAERPELRDEHHRIATAVFPRFVTAGDHGGGPYWGRIFREAPEFQVTLLDDDGSVLAAGNTIPVALDDGRLPVGWEAALRAGVEGRAAGVAPTTLCALSATVDPAHQGKRLSGVLLAAMRRLALEHGLDAMIAPVRPTLKERYPLVPIERYVQWRNDRGEPFDPWLRVHHRMGAPIVGLAPASMTVRGSIAGWEEWTGMRFPDSGLYTVPGALTPVVIDLAADEGRNVEPNVWMRHPV
jgi:GNAT superfamily N-acetyltransferase